MTTPHPAEHGEYVPSKGFYDRSRRGWVRDPAKLTPVTPAPPTHAGQVEEMKRWGHHSDSFTANSQLEQLRRLRDSDKPEERATAQRLLAGSMRMTLHDYEAKRAEAIESGDWQPPTT